VREPDGYEMTRVDGVPLLPLSQIESRFTEFDPNQQYHISCTAGVRLMRVLNLLRQQGFKHLKRVKRALLPGARGLTPKCRGTEWQARVSELAFHTLVLAWRIFGL